MVRHLNQRRVWITKVHSSTDEDEKFGKFLIQDRKMCQTFEAFLFLDATYNIPIYLLLWLLERYNENNLMLFFTRLVMADNGKRSDKHRVADH